MHFPCHSSEAKVSTACRGQGWNRHPFSHRLELPSLPLPCPPLPTPQTVRGEEGLGRLGAGPLRQGRAGAAGASGPTFPKKV